jgi:hypothetical protein
VLHTRGVVDKVKNANEVLRCEGCFLRAPHILLNPGVVLEPRSGTQARQVFDGKCQTYFRSVGALFEAVGGDGLNYWFGEIGQHTTFFLEELE